MSLQVQYAQRCGHLPHVCTDHAVDNQTGKKSKESPLIKSLEKVSALALGIFSAYIDVSLFVPFFLIGTVIGVYSLLQNEKDCSHSQSGSSCSQGFLEHLTGIKLPAAISLAANFAITVCHIDHHAPVFVPIIGLSLGAWVGKLTSHHAPLFYRKVTTEWASFRHVNTQSCPA